ncbi:uncharacterized protein LOC5504541 [Nematostella vectensis]|uniref:uncharacterized protein LOC5504541 n=1 Tax=Nematostella vectensis TaxID=45351 RepID=UPI00138FC290|nr:uncharacterized protein LOC5504541 [Nematostella vectensis]
MILTCRQVLKIMAEEQCAVVFLPSVKIENTTEEDDPLNEDSVESPTCSDSFLGRFGDSSEEEIQRLLEERSTRNTKKANRFAVRIFREYLREKGHDPCFEDYDKTSLNNILRKFYVEARKRDGDFYKKSALSAIRFALNRHLQLVRNIDIINDPEFRVSSEVFRAQTVELMRLGKGIDHIADISAEDLKKLYFSDVFNQLTPEGLQKKSFFDLMYLSGSKRSRGNLREQTRDTFAIGFDQERNMRFIYSKKDSNTTIPLWKIYEKKGNPRCPVATFSKYLSKLNPMNASLWQRPKKSASEEDQVWYEISPMGHNTLGKMMECLSKEAKLSRVYSNNSLKGNNADILDDPTLQNSMLLVSGRLATTTVQPQFQKIVPKITPNMQKSISVVPVVPLQTGGVLSVQNSVTMNTSPVYSTGHATPLNTPLSAHVNGTAVTPNHIQVVSLSTQSQSTMRLTPFTTTIFPSLSSQAPSPMAKSPLTTHALDTARGTPARQLPVKVFIEQPNNTESWTLLASSSTNGDGRVPNLLKPDQFIPARYKIRFETEIYFKSLAITEYFYPHVEIVFLIKDPDQHYHVPLLLSPFGYSTYRGS